MRQSRDETGASHFRKYLAQDTGGSTTVQGGVGSVAGADLKAAWVVLQGPRRLQPALCSLLLQHADAPCRGQVLSTLVVCAASAASCLEALGKGRRENAATVGSGEIQTEKRTSQAESLTRHERVLTRNSKEGFEQQSPGTFPNSPGDHRQPRPRSWFRAPTQCAEHSATGIQTSSPDLARTLSLQHVHLLPTRVLKRRTTACSFG